MAIIGTLVFLLPLAVSWFSCRQMIRLAPRLKLIDIPDDRKAHGRPVPLGGGIGIYLGVLFTMAAVVVAAWLVRSVPAFDSMAPDVVRTHAAGVMSKLPLLSLLLMAALVQLVLGAIDDWRGLGFQVRLAAEVLLVLVLASQGIKLAILPGWDIVTVPLTVLWIVGLTNALNFLDNMDALSGGVAAIATVIFGLIALLVGDLFVAGCYFVLAGSLAGFLWHNWPPARIFMGDAGSNFLGFWLGVLTVISTFKTDAYSHVTLLAPLCVLAVPIYDSSVVILIRLGQGKSPFHADRQHLSHRLVDIGFKPVWAVLVIHLLTFATGLGGLILYFVDPAAAGLVLLQLCAMLALLAVLELGTWRRRDQGDGPPRIR